MKHLDQTQKYLANLGVLLIKLHNVHWNVVGKRFVRIHTFTEELYDKVFEDFDAVAELLKMKNEMPLSTMKDYLATASLQEIEPRDFTTQEALEIVKADLEAMRTLAVEIRNAADETGDFETVAMFEDHVAFYSKNIWFINAMLK